MTTKQRILSIRLMQKLEGNPELGAGVIENFGLVRRGEEMARQIRSDCTVGTLRKEAQKNKK